MRELFPNVIIFGGMRCGTTSLFRYLSAHPGVFSSDKKELDTFYYNLNAELDVILEAYKKAFNNYIGKEPVLLEASPRYARKYGDISQKIAATIPDVKVIYLVRNPVDRMLSVYKAIKRSGALKDEVTYDDFIIAMYNQSLDVFTDEEKSKGVLEELNLGTYSPIISTLISDFGKDQVFVESLENLAADPLKVMSNICKFIDMEESFYEGFSFSIENPSISAKWPKLYKAALNVNQLLEPILNRMPRVREAIRDIHHALNKKENRDELSDKTSKVLNDYYAGDRSELIAVIDQLGTCSLPDWLSR